MTDYSTNFANHWTIDFAANYSAAAFRRPALAAAEQSLPAMSAIAFAHLHHDRVQVTEQAELWVESTAGSVSSPDAWTVALVALTDYSVPAEWTDSKAAPASFPA